MIGRITCYTRVPDVYTESPSCSRLNYVFKHDKVSINLVDYEHDENGQVTARKGFLNSSFLQVYIADFCIGSVLVGYSL